MSTSREAEDADAICFETELSRAMAQDAVTIKPLHVVVVGLLAGAAFIATLLVIVRLVIRSAGA